MLPQPVATVMVGSLVLITLHLRGMPALLLPWLQLPWPPQRHELAGLDGSALGLPAFGSA